MQINQQKKYRKYHNRYTHFHTTTLPHKKMCRATLLYQERNPIHPQVEGE